MNIEYLKDQLYETLEADAQPIKVAMLISRAFKDFDLPPNEVVNAALDRLTERKDVVVYGNLHRWRHSEIMRTGSVEA